MCVEQDKNLATGDSASFRYSEATKDYWTIVSILGGAFAVVTPLRALTQCRTHGL